MSAFGYYWNVNVIGKTALRLVRWRSELRRAEQKSRYIAPPLKISPRTKELIARHYLEGRYANLHRKVAWVTSGAPVELLKALDFYVLYPENHAALCGTARAVVDIASEAEAAGYSRDICSYARTDIGTVLSGKTPVGKLPKPDLLLACTNICQTVLFWYRALAHYFNVPLILIDTPFIYTETKDHAVAFVKRQLEEAVPIAEKAAGKSLDQRRFKQITHLSKMATDLWMEIMRRGKHRPAPISVFDQFIHMAPIVEMRGEAFTVDFYAAMLREVERRISSGVSAVANENKRLLWDNLPIWYRLRFLADKLAERGIAVVASTYTNAWGELAALFDPEDPIESGARTYLHPILNRGTGYKLAQMKQMVAEFQLDGAILHSDRSCKPYSIGQIDQRDRLTHDLNIPTLLLEADHNDPRVFAENQVTNRLDTFIEMVQG